jgi:hypothetical protein
MAQAVPTASLVPCVAAVPAGWAIHSFDARDGKGDFVLSSDLSGSRAVEVVLTASCDVRGATRVPTDQASTSRFERVLSLEGGYSGTRYYVFRGGCVRYVFHLKGAARAAPVNDVSLAVSFVTRDQLRKEIIRRSRGHAQLDPAT